MNIETAIRAYLKITAPVATPDDLRADVMRKEYAFERYILEHAAELLALLEAGDRARAEVAELRAALDTLTRVAMRQAGALQDVEYIQYGDSDEAYCPWCHFPQLGPDNPQPHSAICPRQIALGLQEPQP